MRLPNLLTFLILGILCLAFFGFSQNQDPQTRTGLISVGEISRLDPAKKWIEIRSRVDRDGDPSRSGVFHGSVTIGIGTGRSPQGLPGDPTRRDTVRDPRFPSDDPIEDAQRRAPPVPRYIQAVVYLTEKTAYKSGDKPIALEDLRIGDTVQVKGLDKTGPKGTGIEASEVIRTPLVR